MVHSLYPGPLVRDNLVSRPVETLHALKDALAEVGLDPERAAPVLAEFLKTMAAQVGGNG